MADGPQQQTGADGDQHEAAGQAEPREIVSGARLVEADSTMPRISTPAVWVAVTVRPMTPAWRRVPPLAHQVGGHHRLALARGKSVDGAQADGETEGEDAEPDGELLASDQIGE